MSSTKMIVRTLPIARQTAFKLLRAGKFKQAGAMAADVLLQVPKHIKTPDSDALEVIAAVAFYAAKA